MPSTTEQQVVENTEPKTESPKNSNFFKISVQNSIACFTTAGSELPKFSCAFVSMFVISICLFAYFNTILSALINAQPKTIEVKLQKSELNSTATLFDLDNH